jgi:hypothetical protein
VTTPTTAPAWDDPSRVTARAVIADWPPLTSDQRAALAAILPTRPDRRPMA